MFPLNPDRVPILALPVFLLLGHVALAELQGVTEPVGVKTLSIRGGSDNVLSLPLERLPTFSGVVQAVTPTTLTVAAGTTSDGSPVSPNWNANQFVYNAAAGQRQTFFVEFCSGALKGAYYNIIGNGSNTLALDLEGDNLTAHPRLGAVAASDAIRIKPCWRVRDVFQSNGQPLIDARSEPFIAADDILIPSTVSVGTNKAPGLTIFYLAGQGWRAVGRPADEDFGDYIVRPHEAVILRRRNPTELFLVTMGAAAMIRSVSFVPGGNGTLANDSYISLVHPVPVTLDESGLRSPDQANSVIKDSINDFARQDELLAFSPDSTGFNVAPAITYYYRAGQGWKQVGSNTIVGHTVMLQPGTAYIVRKRAQNAGVDWVKEPNY